MGILVVRGLGVFPRDDLNAATGLLGALSSGGAQVNDLATLSILDVGVDLANKGAVIDRQSWLKLAVM